MGCLGGRGSADAPVSHTGLTQSGRRGDGALARHLWAHSGAGERQPIRPVCPGRSWELTPAWGLPACRDLAAELVPLHGACGHDRHPVGGRLQREGQTAAEHLPGGCLWRCQGAEGVPGPLRGGRAGSSPGLGVVAAGRPARPGCGLGERGVRSSPALLRPTEHPRVSGWPVRARGVHHRHPAVRGPGQQLVPGGALSGGRCHHLPECCPRRLQLWGHR